MERKFITVILDNTRDKDDTYLFKVCLPYECCLYCTAEKALTYLSLEDSIKTQKLIINDIQYN